MITNPWDQIYLNSKPKDLVQPYPLFNLILENLHQNNVKRVLDVACGNGRHLTELAKNNFEVFGFDISKVAVKLSQKRMNSLSHKANIIESDMFKKLPYEDKFFDGVIAIQAIYHGDKQDFENSIKEVRRVLKNTGPFVFTISRDLQRSMLGSKAKKFTKIDDFTFIPQTGREKGLIHFYPNKEMIKEITKKYFESTKIKDDDENHYFLVFCK